MAEKHLIRSTFDERAAGYAGGLWHRRYAERLVALAGLRPGQAVLDAGAGTGFATLAIAQYLGPTGRIVAIDLSPGMLAEARRAVDAARLANVEILEADATHLEQFTAGTFDAVICAAALLYMPVANALEEWHRLLAPNGVVGFSTMRTGSPPAAELFRSCAARCGVALVDPSAALGSEDRCRAALDAAGFRDLRIIAEQIEFSAADLARAWDSNVRSPSHAAVRELAEDDREAFRAQFGEALRERLAADPLFARADVLYAFGVK